MEDSVLRIDDFDPYIIGLLRVPGGPRGGGSGGSLIFPKVNPNLPKAGILRASESLKFMAGEAAKSFFQGKH